jgi:hypothetical protein
MHSALIAEWMIGRFTDQERAASIVGDLVELEPRKGIMWFWFSIARVVFSLAWRRPLAFIAAFYAGNLAFWALTLAVSGEHAPHRPPDQWEPVFRLFSGVGFVACVACINAAIRYGPRDRLARLALAVTGSVAAVVYYWWQPIILMVCIALFFSLAWVTAMSSEYLKAALVLLVATAAGFGAAVLSMYLDMRYQQFVCPPRGLAGTQEFQEHPSLLWMAFCVWLITVWAITTACSRMHHRLMRNRQLDLTTEGRQSV